MSRSEPDEGWLSRPRTIRQIWIAFWVILVLTVAAQLVIDVEGHFGIDGWFGFGAWFGFASCGVMVIAAKLLGAVLKKPDDYYRD